MRLPGRRRSTTVLSDTQYRPGGCGDRWFDVFLAPAPFWMVFVNWMVTIGLISGLVVGIATR